MHLKYKPTLNATLGKSYCYGNKVQPYGDVTGVIQEESPINKRLLDEKKAMKRERNKPGPKLSKEEQYILGGTYDGSNATLEAMYSSGYINRPVYSSKIPKVDVTEALKRALEVREPNKRFYAPSILF
jgi:hypothetical protein